MTAGTAVSTASSITDSTASSIPDSISDSTASATTDSTTDDERQPTLRQMLRPFWLVGALLMMLDGLTTYIALSRHSEQGAREGNPIGIWAIDQFGLAGMCTLKVLIGVLMMWRLAATADRGHQFEWLNRSVLLRKQPSWKVRRNAAWALAFSLVLMGVVVGNNLRAIVTLAGQTR
jgi:hypothetical protein